MFSFMDSHDEDAMVKVVGVGKVGADAIEHLIRENVDGVQFVVLDSNPQLLVISSADIKGHIASNSVDEGALSQEECESLREVLVGADMVMIVAGMEGAYDSVLATFVADVARQQGALTVATVIAPTAFEGEPDMGDAQERSLALSRHVDSLLTVSSDRQQDGDFCGSGGAYDELLSAMRGITGLISRPGLINLGVQDLRIVMGEMGFARLGVGAGTGDNSAEEAIGKAIINLLRKDVDLACVRGILVNITAGLDMTIEEFEVVGNVIKSSVASNATVVVGTVIEPEMIDELHVTVLATGIDAERNVTTVQDNSVQAQSCRKLDDVAFPAHPMSRSPVSGNEKEEFALLYDKAVAFVVESRRSNPASVQREFKIGYNRAANLIEQMEAQGIVSAQDGDGMREVLVPQSVSSCSEASHAVAPAGLFSIF